MADIGSRHDGFIWYVVIGKGGVHHGVPFGIFAHSGAFGPRSHLATGNVSFEWNASSLAGLIEATQMGIERTIGRFEPVFVRSVMALQRSIQALPFRDPPISDVGHRCVTFTEKSVAHLELPIVSSREDAYI